MGKLVLNGREYAGIMPNSYPPLIYSDEEREVGVWRDGKPLYEKTLTLSAWSASNNWIDIEHGISNVDKIVDAKGFIIDTSGSFTPIPQPRSGESKGFTIDFTTQYLSYLNNWKVTIGGYLTVQYTKTTDTPGSGKWSPSGLPTKHYSTNEQVIGTWIDGKPLYEIVLSGTANENVDITTGVIPTIDNLITANIHCKSNNGTHENRYYMSNDDYARVRMDSNPNNLHLSFGNSYPSKPITYQVILQYTKTTD